MTLFRQKYILSECNTFNKDPELRRRGKDEMIRYHFRNKTLSRDCVTCTRPCMNSVYRDYGPGESF